MKEDKGRIPLRIILNNFLNHIEKLESHRSPEDSYEKEFQVGCCQNFSVSKHRVTFFHFVRLDTCLYALYLSILTSFIIDHTSSFSDFVGIQSIFSV